MNVYPKRIIVVLFLLAAFAGCSQSPTSAGKKIIPAASKYTSHDTSFSSVGDTTFKFPQVNGSSSSFLVGNSSSVDAKALLLFLATFPDTMASVQIDTAELTLSADYGWNVSLPPAPGQFEIKEVLSAWSAATVTVDSLNGLAMAPTNSADFVITSQDTLSVGRTLTAQFDTSLVRKWINIYTDTLLPRFFSIALVTKPGMTNFGVWGFSQFGSTAAPNLEIIYEKNGVKDSVSLNVGEGTFFATNNPLQLSAGIQTQGGISIYSLVKFNLNPPAFDSIPSNKVVINNATMLMTLKNNQRTIGYGNPDSLVAYFAGSATNFDTVAATYFGYGYRKDTTQTTNIVYTFNVTSMVQQWINAPSGNFGAQVRDISTNSSVDSHVFYSSKDTAYAPRLLITYTRK
jgi:hypothetical protein